MITEMNEPHLKDPLYRAAMRHMQEGNWEASLAEVASLVERYPLDQALRSFSQMVQIRARVDQDEQVDQRRQAWRRRWTLFAQGLVALVLVVLGYWGFTTYSEQLGQQMTLAREAIALQAQALELAAKFRDAQALLRADRPTDARALLEEIAVIDPGYPGLEAAMAQTEADANLSAQYAQAMTYVQAQNWAGALSVFEEISAQEPNYKDVSQQIDHAQTQVLLGDMLAKADGQYASGAWDAALAGYEGIRALNPSYREDVIPDRLFECYVNAARVALLGQADSLEALAVADTYYRRALALRPQDRRVKTDRELAHKYLGAQADFAQGLWSDVIVNLESLYAVDPEYASGAARQTLYEAYVARGDKAMKDGEYETALSDYERAVALAEERPDAVLRLYQGYLKAAEAQAAQKQYEAAVLLYRSAVELGGLEERANGNPTLARALSDAARYADANNFPVALERYRLAIRVADSSQAVISHEVMPGEYLILLASRYRSTVQAIVAANNIANPSLIEVGQVLEIPVLP